MGRKYKPRRTPPKHRRRKNLTPNIKSLRGRSFCRHMQYAIYHCHKFCREEARRGRLAIPLKCVQQRVAASLSVGTSSVEKYHKKSPTKDLDTPGKKRKRAKVKTDLDNFTKGAIRGVIYEYHRKKKHFKLQKVLEKIRRRGIDFKGGKESLRKVLLKLGFTFQKVKGERVLKEKPDIALKRYTFLRKYHDNFTSSQPKHILYQDETWTFTEGTGKVKLWQDNSIESCPSTTTSSGARYIISHIGGKDGFVPEAGMFVKACKNPKPDDDYHGDMTGESWHKWLRERVLPNLTMPCLIIMDNAPYHSVQVELQPQLSWTKKRLVKWLEDAHIQYDPAATRPELAAFAKLHAKPIVYLAEDIVKNTCHQLLRLPPYHFEWNAIELVWNDVKSFYNKIIHGMMKRERELQAGIEKNEKELEEEEIEKAEQRGVKRKRAGWKDKVCRKAWNLAVKQVGPEKWAKYVDHTHKLTMEAWENDVGPFAPPRIQPIIIHLSPNSSDSESDENMNRQPPLSTSFQALGDNNILSGLTTYSEVGLKLIEEFEEFEKSNGGGLTSDSEVVLTLPGDSEELFEKLKGADQLMEFELENPGAPNFSSVIQQPPAGNEVFFYESVDAMFSLQWSYIASRLILPTEVHAAVNSIIDPNTSPAQYSTSYSQPILKQPNTPTAKYSYSQPILTNQDDTIMISDDDNEFNESTVAPLFSGTETYLGSLEELLNQPSETVVVSKFNINVKIRHLNTLKLNTWLVDEIVNFYFKLIQNQHPMVYAMNSFFYCQLREKGFMAVMGWTKQKKIIIIPIHGNHHWSLCVVRMVEQTITHYDSMLASSHGACLQVILNYIRLEYKRQHPQALDRAWTTIEETKITRQGNGDDCGVFACWYARRISEEQTCVLQSSNVSETRNHIMREVISCYLLPEVDLNSETLQTPQKRLFDLNTLNLKKREHIGGGFRNMGNTCYLNAVLQALFHCQYFLEWLSLGHSQNQCSTDCITCILTEIMEASLSTKIVVDPSRLIARLAYLWSEEIQPYEQQDCHEFLRKLLDRLQQGFLESHMELNLDIRSQETTPIHEIFGGYIKVTDTCQKCFYKSTKHELFLDVSVNISKVKSLDSAVREHFKTEYINKKCNYCRKDGQATRKTEFSQLPPVLCIHLKRFDYEGNKIHKNIRIPPILDLYSGEKRIKLKLQSVITHHGFSQKSGHYTTVAQCSNGHFYKFDDADVKLASMKEAISGEGYIYFYQKL